MGGEVKDIESCLPRDWKTEQSTDYAKSQKAFANSAYMHETIDRLLNNEIDLACKFKNNIKDFIIKKNGARRRRIFFELDSHNKVSSSSKVTVKKSHSHKKISVATGNPFDKVAGDIENIHKKVLKILNSPVAKKVTEFTDCLKTIKTSTKGFMNVVNKYNKNVIKMFSGLKGFIKVEVDLLCNWKPYKEAIGYLRQGTTTTDLPSKWHSYGRFLGRIIHTIGSK
jgi:hypothetical protein